MSMRIGCEWRGFKIFCGALGLLVATHVGVSADESIVKIAYEQPKKASFKPLLEKLKQHRILERMQEILTNIDLPEPLTLRFSSCGSDDAFYAPENKSVTFCYELVKELVDAAPKRRAPSGVSRRDAIAGSISIIFLHEIGHALFDLLKVPVFGREEDAADQVATYTLLHLAPEDSKRLINGAAFALNAMAKGELEDKGTLADEHPLSAQRFYNTLCLAYGADQDKFAYLVKRHYLPGDRAESCEIDYQQVQYAFTKLIAPSVKPQARESLEKAFHR